MKRSFWLSPFIIAFTLLCLLNIADCGIFDWFRKGSSKQQSGSSYSPPAVPETLEQEKPAVQARVNEFALALEAQNVEKAANFCIRDDLYKETFGKDKSKMPLLGQALKNAHLISVAEDYTQNGCRLGVLAVKIGSETFSVTIVKDGGQWYFQDL